MIAILLLPLLQLSTAAVLRQQDSMMLGLDDSLGAMLYELPEYEDPQMLEYELSQLEDHPIVSLIHLARKHAHNKNVLSKEAIANFKLQLDSVITRLQTVQARMEKGSTEIPVEDIEKSIQDLKKLEHIVRPNIDELLTAMHQGLSHSEHLPQGGILNARSMHLPQGGILNARSMHPHIAEVTTPETEIYEFRPLTTEPPVHEKKPIKFQMHEIGQPATKPPVHEIEPLATEPPVFEMKPTATELPVFALPPPSTEAPKDTSQEEDERRAPYKDEVFKGGSIKERYEMNPYQSRWTWKTASFVK